MAGRNKIVSFAVFASLSGAFFTFHSQHATTAHPATIAEQLATDDRLRKPGWWPTKGSPRREDFVGDAVCARCHSEIAAVQKTTSMAKTATRAEDSVLLTQHSLNYHLGRYHYQAAIDSRSANYVLKDGESSFSAQLKWAFGIRMGQSYLF